MKHWSLLVVALAMTGQAFAQDQGPLNSSSTANIVVAGSQGAWSDVTAPQSFPPPIDFAFSPTLTGSGEYSDRLIATGFGFSIPAGSIIRGIEVQIFRSSSSTGNTSQIADREVYLVKGGVVQDGPTQNQANTTGAWPEDPLIGGYGGAVDLWFNTWTVADINSPDFGVVFSVQKLSGSGGGQEGRIWTLQMRVFYDSPLPISLKSFDLQRTQGDDVRVSFVTTQEANVADFEIQRSSDGRNFTTIHRLKPPTPNSELERSYSFVDQNPLVGVNLYRLKQNDLDGKFEIFPVRSIKIDGLTADLKFIQASSNTIRIAGISKGGSYNLFIRDINGRLLQNERVVVSGFQKDATVTLKPGIRGVVLMSLVSELESRTVRMIVR